MKINTNSPLKVLLLCSVFILHFSCSKDTDLLTDYVLSDTQKTLDIGQLVKDDRFIISANGNITLDVLANDAFENPEEVMITETSTPSNGTVEINNDNTLTYTPDPVLVEQVTESPDTPNPEVVDIFTYTTEVVNEDASVNTQTGNVTISLNNATNKTLSDDLAIWQEKFDAEWIRALPFYTNELTGNGTQRRYYDFRAIDCNIAMLQATGDTKYIDNIIWYVDGVKDLATLSNDGYYDWPVNGTNYQLYDGHGLRNIFKFLWILKKYPSIRALSNYQEKYEEYLTWFTTNLWDKWASRGCQTILRSNAWMASHMASNMALFLYLLEDDQTKKGDYISWVDAWSDDINGKCTASGVSSGIGFRDQIRIDGVHGGYVWNGRWGSMTGHSDVSHTNAEVQAVINQYMNGIGSWDLTDMSYLMITLNAILDNSPDADFAEMPYALDAVYDSGDDNGLYITYGWSMLGRFDQTLQTKLAGASNKQFKASFYYNDFLGIMAYNQAYLDGALVYPEF